VPCLYSQRQRLAFIFRQYVRLVIYRQLDVAYTDIKSAFDSVDRVALWKALRGSGMPPFLLQLIRDLHTGTTARVRTPQGMSDVFYTTSGVRQGCIVVVSSHK